MYKGTPIILSADFSEETLGTRRKWDDILKLLKEENCQSRIINQVKLSLRIEGELKSFPDKHMLKKFITTNWP